jgi:hypothetical protein
VPAASRAQARLTSKLTKPVVALGRVVDGRSASAAIWMSTIARSSNTCERLVVAPSFATGRDRLVVVGRAADRLAEDARVRGHAGDAVVDQALELAAGDKRSAHEVEPGALAGGREFLQGVHPVAPFGPGVLSGP